MSTTEDIGAVGSMLTNEDLAREAIALWEDQVDKVAMEPTSGGDDNIVQYLTHPMEAQAAEDLQQWVGYDPCHVRA